MGSGSRVFRPAPAGVLGRAKGRILGVHAGGGFDLHNIRQVTCAQRGAKQPVVAVTGVGDDHRRRQPPVSELIDHLQGQLGLWLMPDLVGDLCPGTAQSGLGAIIGRVSVGVVPACGQEQPPVQRAGRHVGHGVHADADLDVADLAQCAGVLPGHPGGKRGRL